MLRHSVNRYKVSQCLHLDFETEISDSESTDGDSVDSETGCADDRWAILQELILCSSMDSYVRHVVMLWGSLVAGVPIVVRSNFLEVGLN